MRNADKYGIIFYSCLAALIATLAACGKTPQNTEQWSTYLGGSGEFAPGKLTIKGLEDCTAYPWIVTAGDHLSVIRCPNSSTSTQYSTGKNNSTHVGAIVVDNGQMNMDQVDPATLEEIKQARQALEAALAKLPK